MASAGEITLVFSEKEFDLVCRALDSYKRLTEEKRRSPDTGCEELEDRKLQAQRLMEYARQENLPTGSFEELLTHVERLMAARKERNEGLLSEAEELDRLAAYMQRSRQGAPAAEEPAVAEEAAPAPASAEEAVCAEEES